MSVGQRTWRSEQRSIFILSDRRLGREERTVLRDGCFLSNGSALGEGKPMSFHPHTLMGGSDSRVWGPFFYGNLMVNPDP